MENPFKNGEKMERDEKGRYVKGWKGGPGRTPGSVSLTTMIKKVLQEIVQTTEGTKRERIETLARNIVHMAVNEGNEAMIKLIWNYVDGMPKESLEMKGEIEHKENKLIDLLKDADEETRKKVIDGFVKILRGRRERGDL
jgi:hypothetical protein